MVWLDSVESPADASLTGAASLPEVESASPMTISEVETEASRNLDLLQILQDQEASPESGKQVKKTKFVP